MSLNISSNQVMSGLLAQPALDSPWQQSLLSTMPLQQPCAAPCCHTLDHGKAWVGLQLLSDPVQLALD